MRKVAQATALTGYKKLGLTVKGENLFLFSVYDHSFWIGDPPKLQAQCYFLHRGKIPSKSCMCGIYATKDVASPLMTHYCFYGLVFAIRMWGKVFEGEKGFRAEYALVEGLSDKQMCCWDDCSNKATVVHHYVNQWVLSPSCAMHGENKRGAIHFDALAAKLSLPVVHVE